MEGTGTAAGSVPLVKALSKQKAQQVDEDMRKLHKHRHLSFRDTGYIFVKVLGRGRHGNVKMAKKKSMAAEVSSKERDEFLAVRTIERNQNICSRGVQRELLSAREGYRTHMRHILALREMDHPNVQRLFHTSEDSQEIHLVMELYTGGDLLARERGPLTEARAAWIICQIVTAMCHAHAKGIVHQDLRPDNIHYASKSSDSRVVVTNWSCCEYVSTPPADSRKCLMTNEFSAPELEPTTRTDRADMWSVGVIAFALLTFQLPFGDHGPRPEVCDFQWTANEAEGLEASGEFRSFVESLLRVRPSQRMSATAARCHPWLTNARDDHLRAAGASLSRPLALSMYTYGRSDRFHRLAYRLAAEHLSEEHLKSLTHVFTLLDRDGDGFVEASLVEAELLKAMRSEAPQREYAAIGGSRVEAMSAATVMDTSGDGFIGYSEFLASAADSVFLVDNFAAWQTFRALDRDNSGRIEKTEIIRMLEKERLESLSEQKEKKEEMHRLVYRRGLTGIREVALAIVGGVDDGTSVDMFEQMDRDSNNMVDFEEFRDMMALAARQALLHGSKPGTDLDPASDEYGRLHWG